VTTATGPFPKCRARHRPALALACGASLLIHGGLLAAAHWAREGAKPVPTPPLVAIPVIDPGRLKPPSGALTQAVRPAPVAAKAAAAATTRTNTPPAPPQEAEAEAKTEAKARTDALPAPHPEPEAKAKVNEKAEAKAKPKTTQPQTARAKTAQASARPAWTRNPPLPPRRPVSLAGLQPATPPPTKPRTADPMRNAPPLVKTAPVTAPRAGAIQERAAALVRTGAAKILRPPAAGRGLSRARVAGLGNPPPAYPWISRNRGEQGRVILDVEVTAEGRARAVRVKRSSGSKRLDEAALAAVRDWRFAPARRGGQAVPGRIDVPITFRLTD